MDEASEKELQKFKEYLQGFLNRYGVNPVDIGLDSVCDYNSTLKQLKTCNIDSSEIQCHLEVMSDLLEKNIYIYKSDYKASDEYLLEKDEWICTNENARISTENYIERFLLTRDELLDVYELESIYAMGNPYELEYDQCRIVAEILKRLKLNYVVEADDNSETYTEDNPDDITGDIMAASPDLITKLCRPCELFINRGVSLFNKQGEVDFTHGETYQRSGGLIDRLKIGLNFDITLFDEEEFKAEICKIIYFFFKLEHTPIISELQGKHSERDEKNKNKNELYFNAVDFLVNPSMENIGYSFSGKETYNGKITDLIKNKIEKEMYLKETSLEAIDDIKDSLDQVADTWDKLLNKAHEAMDMGEKFDFDHMNLVLDSIIDRPRLVMGKWVTWDEARHHTVKKEDWESVFGSRGNTYHASPIATLYLKVSQFERLGEVKDKILVNGFKIKSKYNVSKFIERMEPLKNKQIGIDGVKGYIDRHIPEIAELVYLKLNPTEDECQSIKDNKEVVPIVLKFCTRANPFINMKKKIPKLLIISCLQAILVDKLKEVKYTFYDYEHHMNTTHTLKNVFKQINAGDKDKHFLEAVKFCWAQRMQNHWYANLGKYKGSRELRELENNIYEVLTKIYSCPNVP